MAPDPDIRTAGNRGPLLAAALSFLVAVVLALVAEGVAGDEEAGHFQMARHAFRHPENFLSIYGRPLVTLILSLPSQAGFAVARLAAAVATGVTAFVVARLAFRAGWTPPWVAAMCLMLQPFFLAHTGTTMTEPWAACLIALAVLALAEKRSVLLALSVALAATARTELSLFLPVAFLVLLGWRRYGAMILLPAGLLVWNLFGFLRSGDPLWLLHQVSPKPYPAREPLHYVKAFVWIVGLGTFVPIVVGGALAFFAGLRRGEDSSAAPARRALVGSAVFCVLLFLVYTYLATWRPLTFGNFRYIAFGAAPLALLAAAGLKVLSQGRRPVGWIGLGAALLGAVLLWRHPVILGSDILARSSPVPAVAAGLWILWYAILSSRIAPKVHPYHGRWGAAVLMIVLGVFSLARDHRANLHLRETPEQAAVREAAGLLDPNAVEQVTIYSAHTLLAFHVRSDPFDRERWPSLRPDLMQAAEDGALWFWESHYTPRPGAAFNIDAVLTTPEWEYLGGVVAEDRTWAGAFFVKRSPGDRLPRDPAGMPLVERGMDRDAWADAARAVESGAGYARLGTEADPDDPRRWLLLADRLAVAGRHDEAWEALERAEGLGSDDPRTWAVRANLLLLRGDLAPALDAVRKARALEAGDAVLELLNGQILWSLGRAREARPLVLGAADRLPARWDAQLLAGDVLYAEEDWRGAWAYYLSALSIKPDLERAGLGAAACARRLGNTRQAEEQLRFLVRTLPRAPAGYVALGDLLVELNRVDEAREVWETGLVETGNDSLIAERLKTLDSRP